MKRHPVLMPYSREHHTALVLAKQALRLDLTDRLAVTEFMAVLPDIMQDELDPHFRQEEQELLTLLRARGRAALAERTLHEHLLLRSLAEDIEYGHASAIPAFGQALEEHVRFEERALFAEVADLFAEMALDAVAP